MVNLGGLPPVQSGHRGGSGRAGHPRPAPLDGPVVPDLLEDPSAWSGRICDARGADAGQIKTGLPLPSFEGLCYKSQYHLHLGCYEG